MNRFWLITKRCLFGLVFATSLFLGACSVVDKVNPWSSNIAFNKVEIIALSDANLGYSVEIDVVFILDEKLGLVLSELTAAQWFAAHPNRRRSPGTGQLPEVPADGL